MRCFVCDNPEVEVLPTAGDRASVECSDCGSYEISETVIEMLAKAHWLQTEAMQHWISERHAAGDPLPLITSDVAVYGGGVRVQG